ncbi:VWA domain-containing protein [Halalkalibacter nanhaiisediminis]|nr:VWA domain-containing protein [Halalkalibacter nanhaiisediminis]
MNTVQKKNTFLILLVFLFMSSFFSDRAHAMFKDVSTNHWAYSSIEWAINQGLIKGYADGTYRPQRTLTEAEFVTMLIRYDCSGDATGQLGVYTGEHWASGNYRFLQRKNIPLRGYSNVALRDQPMTRGQMARIVAAFNGLDLSEPHAVQYMYIQNLSSGMTGKRNYNDYGVNRSLNRAEAAVFLERIANKGRCRMEGLRVPAAGLDNQQYYPFPVNFFGNETATTFSPPTSPPVVTQPGPISDLRLTDVEIEKQVLTSNGVDSTFINLTLKDCYGNPIPYDESISFNVSSEGGASLAGGGSNIPSYSIRFGTLIYSWGLQGYTLNGSIISNHPEIYSVRVSLDVDGFRETHEARVINNEYTIEGGNDSITFDTGTITVTVLDRQGSTLDSALYVLNDQQIEAAALPEHETTLSISSTSTSTWTDGPELAVEVTAPQSNRARKDTISFRVTSTGATNMACYRNPIEIPLSYEPKAELRVEAQDPIISADGSAKTQITAKIVRPGGQTITNFNGRVQFRSAQGAYLSNSEVNFINGVATTTLTSISTSRVVTDQIFAEIVSVDNRYRQDIESVLNQSHSTDVVYDPKLQLGGACTVDDLEIAFVIDSSGSMRQTDRDRLRVSKSQELLSSIGANQNIATHFNGRGHYLAGPAIVPVVSPTLQQVIQSGGTNMGAGLEVAFSNFTTNSTKKVAILLTDGRSSQRKVTEMMEKAKAEGITIYTVGLGKKNQLNEALLQKIAEETGGKYFHAQQNIDISTAYQSILDQILCDVPPSGCVQSGQIFSGASLKSARTHFYMETFMNNNCGDIDKVIVRFHATDGDIDYQLINRGQDYYALKIDNDEIARLALQREGTFLAYNKDGKLVGQTQIPIQYN